MDLNAFSRAEVPPQYGRIHRSITDDEQMYVKTLRHSLELHARAPQNIARFRHPRPERRRTHTPRNDGHR